jgi:hypothetical protein
LNASTAGAAAMALPLRRAAGGLSTLVRRVLLRQT